ncbi:MAG: LuxR family transcriptional regulator [Alphaproteobacteria bacterium]|nr:LuxR family transcriptional regulator [Alphaproteobacteria bacterium]
MSRLDDVNAFITQSRACRTADDLRRLMEAITREMGFESYALFQHVKNFSWTNNRLLAISNYSRGWLEYFFENDFGKDDPAMVASYRTSVGFRLAEIPSLITMTERHQKILSAARSAGIVDAFCVPAHIPGEINGSCTFTVGSTSTLPEANFPMAQLVGNFAYEAARRIQLAASPPSRVGGNPTNSAVASPTITTRQLQCLALVAKGKSDWEISRILGIGQETVKHHIRSARERYDVGTRVQAAIHAIADGQLTIYDVIR